MKLNIWKYQIIASCRLTLLWARTIWYLKITQVETQAGLFLYNLWIYPLWFYYIQQKFYNSVDNAFKSWILSIYLIPIINFICMKFSSKIGLDGLWIMSMTGNGIKLLISFILFYCKYFKCLPSNQLPQPSLISVV